MPRPDPTTMTSRRPDPDDAATTMRFARWTECCDSDTKDFLTLTERPDVISLAGGLPAPEIFPANAVAAAVQSVLKSHAPRALQYGPTEGIAPLRGYA